MLTEAQLLALLADLESDRVERTVSVADTDKFCQAICAFANDLPNHRQAGYLLIGVRDDGTPSGLQVSDELLQKLGAIRADGNVLPSPAMNVQKYRLNDGEIAVVEVTPSDMPPVRYKGRVYIRVGPRKAVANEQEERILIEKRVARAHTFDMMPVYEAKIEDIAPHLFEEYRAQAVAADVIEANHRPMAQQLASLRLFDLNRNCPTVAGILLFSPRPRYFMSGAYIQFLRFAGTDMTVMPVDQVEFWGSMRSVLDGLRDKFRALNQVGMQQGEGFRDKLLPDYPEWAVREFLHNAVMHRDYQSSTPIRFYCFADRIEIQNSGGLYGDVTAATLMQRNSYRNPVLAEALKAMGYVNKFGFGIQRAQAMLVENGNPEATLSPQDQVVSVTIWKRTR